MIRVRFRGLVLLQSAVVRMDYHSEHKKTLVDGWLVRSFSGSVIHTKICGSVQSIS